MLMNKALLMASGKKGPIRYFEFVASRSGYGVDFFSGSAPSSWVVSVNGAPTSQSASALKFSLGATVRIEYDETPAASFSASDKNYFKTIDGAIPVVESTSFSNCFNVCRDLTSVPEGLFANNPNVTNFSSCFFNCEALTSVPEGLFANNPNVTDFSYCFQGCDALTPVPERLFANNSNVMNFSHCFQSCNLLTSVPERLFANNPNVTDFSSCFYYCKALTVRVRISSAKVSSAKYFAYSTKTKGTVYVPSGSATASTFKSATNANVTVIEE